MNELHAALEQFNEGFSAYLYALKTNAFCVEWNEAPDVHSWQRLQELSGGYGGDGPQAPSRG
jgi:DASH complex subunit DAM1